MNVRVAYIDHRCQRYPTVGDWIYYHANDLLDIKVSKMGDWKFEYLVFFHELTEATLCIARGIREKDVTDFDLWYENQRLLGNTYCQAEPGDHFKAPYRKEHFFATSVERLMAAELEVDWEKYDAAVEAL